METTYDPQEGHIVYLFDESRRLPHPPTIEVRIEAVRAQMNVHPPRLMDALRWWWRLRKELKNAPKFE